MSYLAYLHCAPVAKDGKRSKQSRLQMYYAIKGAVPKMPVVRHEAYLTDWLSEAGTVMIGANGFVPLNWQELQAWCQMTGRRLDWWQAETLRKMSEAYANWAARGQQYDAEPPWSSEPVKSKSDKIKDTIKSVRIQE